MTEEELSQQAPRSEPLYARRGRRTWLTVLLCVVILLCGMAIGSGITLRWLHHKRGHIRRHPENAAAAMTKRLRSRLDLTEEQARQVEEILRKHQKSLLGIRLEVQPRVLAEFEKVRTEVAETLTPEQVKQWNAYFETRRWRWFPPPPLPPPPPPSAKPSTGR